MKNGYRFFAMAFLAIFLVSIVCIPTEPVTVQNSQTIVGRLSDPADLTYYETHFDALADPTYNYGTSTLANYLKTLVADNDYHVSMSSPSGSPASVYDLATGEPLLTYGTSSGTYDYTLTQNGVFQSVESTSYIGGDTYANKTVTGYPTYTYGSSTSGGIWQTYTSNDSYHVSTTSSYSGSSSSQTKATTTWVDNAGTGTRVWSNPTYAQSSNNLRATSVTSAKGKFEYTHYLWGSAFGFSVTDGSLITGIVVQIEASKSTTSGTYAGDNIIRLVKAGSVVGDNKASKSYTTIDTTYSYGSSSNLWGTTWSESEVEASNFGIAISCYLDSIESAGNAQAQIDYVAITVYWDVIAYRIDMYYQFQFTEAPRAQVSAIFYYAEGKTSGDTVKIHLWNWTTSTWLDTSQVWDTSEHTVSAGLDIEWYMNAEGYLRIRFYQTGLTASRTVSADYLIWHIHYLQTLYRIDYHYSMAFSNATRAEVTNINWGSFGYSTVASKIHLYNWSSNSWYDTGQTVPASNSLKEGTGVSITSFMHSNGSMMIRYTIDAQSSSFINYVDWVYWYVTWGGMEYSLDFYYQFDFTNASKDYVTAIDWGAEGKTSNPTMSIYIHNYVGSTWTDTGADWTTSESTQSGEGDRTLHVASNGSMAMRFAYSDYASSFTASVDHIWFNVTWVCPVSDPILKYPVDGYTTNNTHIMLQWDGVQVISGNLYRYQVWVSNTSSFTYKELNVNTTNDWYYPATSLTVGTKYWKVRPIDYLGNVGSWTGVWSFHIVAGANRVKYDIVANDYHIYYGTTFDTLNKTYYNDGTFWTLISSSMGAEYGIEVYFTFVYNLTSLDQISEVWFTVDGIADVDNWVYHEANQYNITMSAMKRIGCGITDVNQTSSAPCDVNYALQSNGTIRVFFETFPLQDEAHHPFHVHFDMLQLNVYAYVNDTIGPTAPNLFYPLDSQLIDFANPLFCWNETTDDMTGIGSYNLQISTVSNFATLYQNVTTTKLWYQFSVDFTCAIYYWRVRGVDGVGNLGTWSSTRSFRATSDPEIYISYYDWDGDGVAFGSVKSFINGSRITNPYVSYPESSVYINLTVTDYFDNEIFQKWYTISSTPYYIDEQIQLVGVTLKAYDISFVNITSSTGMNKSASFYDWVIVKLKPDSYNFKGTAWNGTISFDIDRTITYTQNRGIQLCPEPLIIDSVSFSTSDTQYAFSVTTSKATWLRIYDNESLIYPKAYAKSVMLDKSTIYGLHSLKFMVGDDDGYHFNYTFSYFWNTREVILYLFSTYDNKGLDFNLVKWYINGTRIYSNDIWVSGTCINITLTDFGTDVVYTTMATYANEIDIGLGFAEIEFFNNGYNSIVIDLTKITGSDIGNFTIPSGSSVALRLINTTYNLIAYGIQDDGSQTKFAEETLVVNQNNIKRYYINQNKPEAGGGTGGGYILTNIMPLVNLFGIFNTLSTSAMLITSIFNLDTRGTVRRTEEQVGAISYELGITDATGKKRIVRPEGQPTVETKPVAKREGRAEQTSRSTEEEPTVNGQTLEEYESKEKNNKKRPSRNEQVSRSHTRE